MPQAGRSLFKCCRCIADCSLPQVARNCYNYKALQLARDPECIAAIQSVQANGQAGMDTLAQELAAEAAEHAQEAAVAQETPRARSAGFWM